MSKPIPSSLVKVAISVVLAVIVVRFYIQSEVNQKMRALEWVDVLVASRDLPAQTVLKISDVKTAQVLRRDVQPLAFIEKVSHQNEEFYAGKKTLIPVPSGTQLTRAMIADVAVRDIETAIPRGKRAYALYLPRNETLRLIHAGSYVDIVANLQTSAKTVLQNILVLSVRDEIYGQSAQKHSTAAANDGLFTLLALAVTPQEAELLATTEKESQGDFRILIRSKYDSGLPR